MTKQSMGSLVGGYALMGELLRKLKESSKLKHMEAKYPHLFDIVENHCQHFVRIRTMSSLEVLLVQLKLTLQGEGFVVHYTYPTSKFPMPPYEYFHKQKGIGP